MSKITKKDIERLANEIISFLEAYGIADSVSIYYNGNVVRSKTENVWDWGNSEYKAKYTWVKTYDVDPHDYFEYAAYDHILSMSFEGGLYDVLNYIGGSKMYMFMNIFRKYGLFYELGNAWNLSCHRIEDDTEIEYTYYEEPKKKIYLYNGDSLNPSELQNIMDVWYDLSKREGDKGCCVLGAGFKFKWRDDKYFMPACSPWQGSLSWESHKDVIHKMLEEVGATEIYYEWGRID